MTAKDSISAVAGITQDPRRLEALCELWKGAGRSVWVTLRGYSMAPELLPGTKLKIRCGEPVAKISVGDILAFRREGNLVIHRLVEIAGGKGEPTRFICQGDANPERDPAVTGDLVLGRVVEIRRPAVLTRLRKRLGHFLLTYRRRSIAARREAAP